MSANGRLTDAELTSVDGVRLARPTANAWARLKAAAHAAGISLWIALPAGGYRDLVTQANIANKNPDSTVPIAATGASTHGFGSRVDVGSFGAAWPGGAARAAWLLAHASEFGFYREFGDRDPNHFAHDGFTAAGPILTAAGGTSTTPIEEDDMPTPEDYANAVEARLRSAKWVLGPQDEAIPLERALRDLAVRQVGYGRRTQDVQDNLLPAVLGKLDQPAPTVGEVRLSEQDRAAIIAGVLDGLAARLDG